MNLLAPEPWAEMTKAVRAAHGRVVAAIAYIGIDAASVLPLKQIAHELVKAVRESATIDWNLKESVRAGMRAKVRRLLARYGYPPDKEERAIELVLEQAELLAADAA